MVETSRYLISTSGSQFKHPDREAVARILKRKNPCELWFNYRSKQTDIWDEAGLIEEWAYKPIYPQDPDHGVTLSL